MEFWIRTFVCWFRWEKSEGEYMYLYRMETWMLPPAWRFWWTFLMMRRYLLNQCWLLPSHLARRGIRARCSDLLNSCGIFNFAKSSSHAMKWKFNLLRLDWQLACLQDNVLAQMYRELQILISLFLFLVSSSVCARYSQSTVGRFLALRAALEANQRIIITADKSTLLN